MMWSITLLAVVAFSTLIPVATSEPAPSSTNAAQPHFPFIAPAARNKPFVLFKRQSTCPADHSSCSNINAPEACCPTGTNCSRDSQGNVACCPVNYYCTGTIGSVLATASGSTSTLQTNGATATGYAGTITVTSTAGVTNSPTTNAANTVTGTSATGAVAGGGSTVQNAYYPFVYMPTSFGNAGVCSAYYTSCQTASTSCFQSLAGINGVTIGGSMGGGTTQVGASGIIQTSASSICSSLSQTACYGLQVTQCAQFGSAGGTASGFVQAGSGPRETACAAMVYAAAVGAAAGALGIVV